MGKCALIEQCDELYRMIKSPASRSEAVRIINKAGNCGFVAKDRLVCCGAGAREPSPAAAALQPDDGRPQQPKAVKPTARKPQAASVIKAAGAASGAKVAPKAPTTTLLPSPELGSQTHAQVPPVQKAAPSLAAETSPESASQVLSRDCGRVLDNRYFRGNRTELDDFPWVALLEYTARKSSRRRPRRTSA